MNKIERKAKRYLESICIDEDVKVEIKEGKIRNNFVSKIMANFVRDLSAGELE